MSPSANHFLSRLVVLVITSFFVLFWGSPKSSADPSKLTNISTRAFVQTGANVEIGGFIVDGTSPKQILIRARGPSLVGEPFNLTGTLNDPWVQLYSGQTVIALNDNWQTTDPLCLSPAISCGNAADITATGLDPCNPNPGQTVPPPNCSNESAILVTLSPGLYTSIVRGIGGTSGIGLVEVYEINASDISKLANISTRARIETGANVEIGGFIIGGTDPKQVLIRARGPSMSGAPFNLAGTLDNPWVQLYSGQTVIAQNDDWQTTDPLCLSPAVSCGDAVDITATGLHPCLPNPGEIDPPPNCSNESVILVTLPPGLYTSIVRGVGATSGIGLVEVYEINAPPAATLSLTPFAQGFSAPAGIYNAGSGDNRLFVIEQAGLIKIVQPDGTILPTPFLDITDRVDSSDNEEGLLGLAFHPSYATNGFFYVNYTNTTAGIRRTRISRFSVTGNPSIADPNSEAILFTVDQPYSNHNAGDIHFGPDGYLYIPLGDGGSGGDPNNYAQNDTLLLGKITRIDVDSGPGTSPDCVGQGAGGYTIPNTNPLVDGAGNTCDEIWAIGLRNPWRSSFDRLTGDFYIGDVGQNAWEEITFQPANSTGGENYGWRCYEGNHAYNLTGCSPSSDYTFPIFEYAHSTGGCSVIGGYVYRGTQYPALYGHYLLTDYCSGFFWDLVPNGFGGWQVTQQTSLSTFGFVSFGEDSAGELYIVNTNNGILYRIQGN